jgi:hypothetical protein
VLCLALALPLTVQAQTVLTGPPDVIIQLMPGAGGQPRTLAIGPRGVGLCPGKKGCDNQVNFIWVGGKNEGEQIKITFDDPVVANACFGSDYVTLTAIGKPNGQSLTVADTCTGKRALFYTVACEGGEGGDCGGVAAVDPGMIIDGGG